MKTKPPTTARRERERERERAGFASRFHLGKRVGKLINHKAWFIITALLVGASFIVGISIGNSANSASPSGTSMPIKKGGTGATNEQNAMQNLLPDFASNTGKVLGSTGTEIG
ncbi:MAG: hypothetical protein LBK50_01305 [Candidatus Nomurabacteria bacterium]|jgi:hypothetical protein|nr:hypothetical protein [Candidatus Nomurabacteria bacterium]